MNDSEKKKCLTLYNYYNSAPIDSFNHNKCNDINLSIRLNINTLKNNYKIKKEGEKYTNTNIFCYKENKNKNTNYNANNENENSEPNENTNSYNLKNLKGILKQYFEELYINKTIIQNDDNIQKLNITKNDKQQTIIFTPIFLSNNETVISYIITFNNKSYNYTYVFLLYDFYNTDLQFNDFIPMIKNKEILSKKINGEKQNQDSLNHSVSSVHNDVQQVLTNSPALLLHLLLKSNKFQFKNVCDTSLIFNTIIDDENENLNLHIDNDKKYEKKFTICSEINKEKDGATLSVCNNNNQDFYNNIKAFFESDKRIFIGFIKLFKKSGLLGKFGNSAGHTNMFIIDKERKIIIQFEPKGHDVLSKASFNKLDIKTQFLHNDYLNVKLMEGGYKFLDTSLLDSISAYCYKHNKTDIYYLNQNKNSNSNLNKKNLTLEQSFSVSEISKSYHDNNCQSYTFCGVLIYCLNPDYIGHPKNLEGDKNLQLQLPLLLLTKYGITYEKVFEFRELLLDFYDSSTNLINTYNKNKNLYFEIINKDKINNNIPELSNTTIKELNENFTDEELSNNFIKINSKIGYKNIYVVKHKYYNTPLKVSKNYIKSIKYINSVISNIPKLKVVFNIDKYEKNKYVKPIQMLNINDLDFEKILKYLYLFDGDRTIEDFIEIYNYMINLKKKSICDILKNTNISNNKQTNKRPNHKRHNNKTRKQNIGNLNNNVNNINNNVNNTRNTDPSLLKKIKNIIYILGLTEEKLLNTIIYNFITSLVTIKNKKNLKKYYPYDYCFYSDNNFKDYIIKLGKIKVEKHETSINTHTQFTEITDKHNNYSYIFIEINDKKELDNELNNNNLSNPGDDYALL